MDRLPDELLERIFTYLDVIDLVAVGQAHNRFDRFDATACRLLKSRIFRLQTRTAKTIDHLQNITTHWWLSVPINSYQLATVGSDEPILSTTHNVLIQL